VNEEMIISIVRVDFLGFVLLLSDISRFGTIQHGVKKKSRSSNEPSCIDFEGEAVEPDVDTD
jgi:hypothetical protein